MGMLHTHYFVIARNTFLVQEKNTELESKVLHWPQSQLSSFSSEWREGGSGSGGGRETAVDWLEDPGDRNNRALLGFSLSKLTEDEIRDRREIRHLNFP